MADDYERAYLAVMEMVRPARVSSTVTAVTSA
jgi:hypothetical protein